MKYIQGPHSLIQQGESEGEYAPIRKGSRQQKYGRLSAYYLRSLRPSIRHYVPAMLLADAMKQAEMNRKQA
jgi:hypothetical protein